MLQMQKGATKHPKMAGPTAPVRPRNRQPASHCARGAHLQNSLRPHPFCTSGDAASSKLSDFVEGYLWNLGALMYRGLAATPNFERQGSSAPIIEVRSCGPANCKCKMCSSPLRKGSRSRASDDLPACCAGSLSPRRLFVREGLDCCSAIRASLACAAATWTRSFSCTAIMPSANRSIFCMLAACASAIVPTCCIKPSVIDVTLPVTKDGMLAAT